MCTQLRDIHCSDIADAVAELCIEANYLLDDGILDAITRAIQLEESETGREILECILNNAQIARQKQMPLCQDTGMAVVFIDLGQDLHIIGGKVYDAVNEGIRKGYEQGFLRKSVVNGPFTRVNTKNNTPAVIHFDVVEGDRMKITVVPKGFGSENKSALKMFNPLDGIEEVKDFVVRTVRDAGPDPCPPIIVGVGIGGTMEKAAILAKKALLKKPAKCCSDDETARLEKELLERINDLGIGPAGLGGRITALAVNINMFPTHIAGLPVAVNINCHAVRHAERVL